MTLCDVYCELPWISLCHNIGHVCEKVKCTWVMKAYVEKLLKINGDVFLHSYLTLYFSLFCWFSLLFSFLLFWILLIEVKFEKLFLKIFEWVCQCEKERGCSLFYFLRHETSKSFCYIPWGGEVAGLSQGYVKQYFVVTNLHIACDMEQSSSLMSRNHRIHAQFWEMLWDVPLSLSVHPFFFNHNFPFFLVSFVA